MNVVSPDWRRLSEDDLQLLYTVGDMLSIAVERAQLFARSTRLGAVEERNRLAREIHDTLAQGLTATTLQLESADALLDAGSRRSGSAGLQGALAHARQPRRGPPLGARPARRPARRAYAPRGAQALVERWEAETGIAARYGAVNGSRPLRLV